MSLAWCSWEFTVPQWRLPKSLWNKLYLIAINIYCEFWKICEFQKISSFQANRWKKRIIDKEVQYKIAKCVKQLNSLENCRYSPVRRRSRWEEDLRLSKATITDFLGCPLPVDYSSSRSDDNCFSPKSHHSLESPYFHWEYEHKLMKGRETNEYSHACWTNVIRFAFLKGDIVGSMKYQQKEPRPK